MVLKHEEMEYFNVDDRFHLLLNAVAEINLNCMLNQEPDKDANSFFVVVEYFINIVFVKAVQTKIPLFFSKLTSLIFKVSNLTFLFCILSHKPTVTLFQKTCLNYNN